MRVWIESPFDNLPLHGYMRSDELFKLLSGCDFGIIPLRDYIWAGLPHKLGDYIAAGIRVLTSLDGECRELVERHRAGRGIRQATRRVADAVLSVLPE